MRTLILFMLLTIAAWAQPPTYTYIISGQQVGPVKKDSTLASLTATVGTAYLEPGTVYLGEGNSTPATVLYPGHPNRMIKIVWKKGPKATATPQSVWLSGTESEWRTPNGISLGTGLARLEKINGAPFKFLGFGWDFSGKVTTWNGRLDHQLEQVFVRLMVPEADSKIVGFDRMTGIYGDVELRSDNPIFLDLNPVIDQIVVFFE